MPFSLFALIGRKYRLPVPLRTYGRKGSSQNNEAGIIDAVLDAIPVRKKFFVEFGIGHGPGDASYSKGLEGNCVELKASGWSGLFMDAGIHPPEYEIKEEFVSDENINQLLAKYRVPADFAIISIDVDGQEYWIWKALRARPELVIVEYALEHGPDDAVTVPRDPAFRWDGTNYGGASLRALWKLGKDKGYTLVHANRVNAFFVSSNLVSNPDDFPFESMYDHGKIHPNDPLNRQWLKV